LKTYLVTIYVYILKQKGKRQDECKKAEFPKKENDNLITTM
jgi:hypothetical protein